jgi:hypothetical protein
MVFLLHVAPDDKSFGLMWSTCAVVKSLPMIYLKNP